MHELNNLMQMAKETGKKQTLVLPALYSDLATFDSPLRNQKTEWTATPNRNGGIDLNYTALTQPNNHKL